MAAEADTFTLHTALRSLPLPQALGILSIIEKLTRNVVHNPSDEKFRKLNLTNEKIKNAIAMVPRAMDLMREMGWVQQEDFLTLPSTVRLAHEVHVIGIIEAQDYYKTQLEKERARQVRASKAVNEETQKLKRQIDADRKEKEAEGPVTKGSVARKLVPGAKVMRVSDLKPPPKPPSKPKRGG